MLLEAPYHLFLAAQADAYRHACEEDVLRLASLGKATATTALLAEKAGSVVDLCLRRAEESARVMPYAPGTDPQRMLALYRRIVSQRPLRRITPDADHIDAAVRDSETIAALLTREALLALRQESLDGFFVAVVDLPNVGIIIERHTPGQMTHWTPEEWNDYIEARLIPANPRHQNRARPVAA